MNKKFSTLMASALLATSVGAFAQTRAVTPGSILVGVESGDYVTLDVPTSNYVRVDAPDPTTGELSDEISATSDFSTPTSIESAFASMWQVTIVPPTTVAGMPTYKFVNKLTQQAFAINLQTNGKDGISTTALALDEYGNDEWGWNDDLGLYAATEDSTFFFVENGGSTYLAAVEGGLSEAMNATLSGYTNYVVTPTAIAATKSVDLTVDGYNFLTQKGALKFGNGKDVKNPTVDPENILRDKTFKASSGKNKQGGTSEWFFLSSTTDSSDIKTPQYLMVDTLYYDLAKNLNKFTIDSLSVEPVYNNSGVLQNYKNASTMYAEVKDKDGKTIKLKSLRPYEPARFTGKYYFAQDSMALYAMGKPKTTTTQVGDLYYGLIADDASVEVKGSAATSTEVSGRILLKYLDETKIVLTPDFGANGEFDDDDAAAEKDFIIPLIQSGWTVEAADDNRTSVDDGVYYIKNKDGQYLAAPIYQTENGAQVYKTEWVSVNDELQNVEHMPAYQWVVLKNRYSTDAVKKTSTVAVYNREFVNTKEASVQLMQKEGAEYLYATADFLGAEDTDSLEFVPVDPTILSDSLLGYKHFDKDSILVNRYTFNYLHEYANDKYIVKAEDDSVLLASDGKLAFSIEPVGDLYQYGFEVTSAVAERIDGLKSLYRSAYKLYIPTANGDLYLGMNKEHKYVLTEEANEISTLLLKEDNDVNAHYYALLALKDASKVGKLADEEYTRVSVSDDDVVLEDQVMDEKRVSAFAVAKYDAPLYRRFNSALLEGNEGDAADTLRFKEMYRGEYLQVEANENFMVDGIDFLGIYTPDFTKDGKSFIVDTTYINRGNGQIKPQYLISIDRTDQAFEEGQRCPICQEIIEAGGTAPANCPHDQAGVMPFHMGKYLVNFADSVKNAENKEDYAWKGYTRAGFVKAAHMGDSLYILTGQFADVTLATFDTAAIHKAVNEKKYPAKYVVNLLNDENKYVTWSMRFLDPENAANEVEEDRAFLMESSAASEIAPITGSWLKMQNGCLVMSGTAGAPSKFDQFTDDDDALIFNIEVGNEDDLATDNEEISASAVTVIAGDGQITISGAAGKKVVVSNILGQVVANTVLTSDNATIAAPQGVVVVAVEGEEAVKAIVK